MRWRTYYLSGLKAITFFLLFFFLGIFSLATQDQSELPSAKNEDPLQKLERTKILLENKDYPEAEKFAREILKEVETIHGAESIQAAQVLDVLIESTLQKKKQVDDDSRVLIERAISIREETLGRDHIEVINCLHNFAKLLSMMGAYAEARDFMEKALKIQEKKFGDEHLEVANTLIELGLIQKETGDLFESRILIERALTIRKKILGSEHRLVALAADNLAIVLILLGEYEQSKILLESTFPILQKVSSTEHPDMAFHLSVYGDLMKHMGQHTKALNCYERALAIREKVYGAEHLEVAYSLNSLANVLRKTGDFERALKYHERSLEIYKKVFGLDHPRISMPLNSLANLLIDMGDQVGGRYLSRRALDIQEKTFGAYNLNLVPYLINYSAVWKIFRPQEAKEFLERALLIQEKNLGLGHPDLASTLLNLADFYQNQDDLQTAISLLERAKIIAEESVGPDHPFMAELLHKLSACLFCAGNLEEALEQALHSEEIVRENLRLISSQLSEREALAYLSAKAFLSIDICLSLAAKYPLEVKGIISKVWDAMIRSRALVLDEMAARHHTVSEIADPKLEALAASLASARQKLANLTVRGSISGTSKENFRILIDKAKGEKERAERDLAEASISFRQEMERNMAGLAEIKESLQAGFSLVAYSQYKQYEPFLKKDKYGTNVLRTSFELESTPSYLAFVITSQEKEPKVVHLGKVEEIERLVFDWNQEVAFGARIPGRNEKESEAAYRAAGEELRRQVWDPIAAHLGKSRYVIMVPADVLHLVNFSVLPVGTDKYIIEKGPLIHYMSAERDLILSEKSPRKGTGLLALGDPAFDESSLFASLASDQKSGKSLIEKAKSFFTFRGMRSECGDFKTLRFSPLPASHKEISEIANLWKKTALNKDEILKLTGDMANERAFKMSAPGKKILHLATHGFFLERNCPSALAISDEGTQAVIGENPLLLTGLALAGANHREVAGPDEEDGILTAEEIAALDLEGVTLAVLSACDSGSGKIKNGEGVFGLRRAFRIAGVQTLITSLWGVEDKDTKDWMEAFYEAIFSKKLQTAEAVREASLEELRKLRKKKKSTHPFYWGGFVASGNWK
jgi:CHAT domain-containing protein/tetratricopeptide (TPR) repeat protein